MSEKKENNEEKTKRIEDIEADVNNFVKNYIENIMDPRVEPFVKKHYKSFIELSKSSVKYCLPDTAIGIRNAGSWIISKFSGYKHVRKTMYKEDYVLDKFVKEVFQPENFLEEFQNYFSSKYIVPEVQKLVELQEKLQEDGVWNKEEFNKKVTSELEKMGKAGELSSKFAVVTAEILIGSWLSGELARGFGLAGGTLAGEAIYISQIGFFSSLWATLFGVPGWVGIIGGVVGASIAFLFIAPILGAIIEYSINNIFIDFNKKMRESYPGITKNLVYGTPEDEKSGLLEKSIESYDVLTEVVDNIYFVASKVAGMI